MQSVAENLNNHDLVNVNYGSLYESMKNDQSPAIDIIDAVSSHFSGNSSTAPKPADEQNVSVTSNENGKTNEIFTVKNFDWAYRNPFATIFKEGNDFVTEQWSEDYFIACKKDVGLFFNSVTNIGVSLYNLKPLDALGHFANAIGVAFLLFLNIEVANFLKGVLGTVVSAVKIPVHLLAALCYTALALKNLVCCNPEKRNEYILKALSNLGYVLKDIVSVMTCFGHAIPSWLPVVAMMVCPPAGIALMVLKTLSNFTGIFDVMAYGGTAALLYTKVKLAQWNSDSDGGVTAKKATDEWAKLKKELNPFKSKEGAILAVYGMNVLLEGAATAIDCFVPGVGTIVKYAQYGTLGATAVGLAAVNVKHHLNERKANEKICI